MTNDDDLTGRVIIITGACGLIGRAFAEACVQFGASVVLADVAAADPVERALELEKRHERPMLGCVVDVANKASVLALKGKRL